MTMRRQLLSALFCFTLAFYCMPTGWARRILSRTAGERLESEEQEHEEDVLNLEAENALSEDDLAEGMRKVSGAGENLEEFNRNWIDNVKAAKRKTNDMENIRAAMRDAHWGKDDESLGYGPNEVSLLEANSSRGKCNREYRTSSFVPNEWVSMLAERGCHVGSGSFGNVYVVDAECSESPQQVAVKVSKKTITAMRDTEKSLLNAEINAGMNFDHKHVVKFFGHGMLEDQSPVIAMEAAGGGDFEEKYKSMTEKEKVKVILEVLYALKYIHDKGHVHCDIKPEQVIFANGITKLSDLGFIQVHGASFVGGSPVFMAPEMFTSGKATKSVDMWSMGVLVYYVMYSKFPINGKATGYWRHKLKFALAGLPQTWATRLINGLLRESTYDRYNVDKAIEVARGWAASLYLVVDAPSFGQSTAAPTCWDICSKANCAHGQRCNNGGCIGLAQKDKCDDEDAGVEGQLEVSRSNGLWYPCNFDKAAEGYKVTFFTGEHGTGMMVIAKDEYSSMIRQGSYGVPEVRRSAGRWSPCALTPFTCILTSYSGGVQALIEESGNHIVKQIKKCQYQYALRKRGSSG